MSSLVSSAFQSVLKLKSKVTPSLTIVPASRRLPVAIVLVLFLMGIPAGIVKALAVPSVGVIVNFISPKAASAIVQGI